MTKSARLYRLSLPDLTILAVEAPDTPMHVGALGVLESGPLLDGHGRLRIGAIRTRIEARLNRVPELRRALWNTRPLQGRRLWVDDQDFRIENHVLSARLPAPGGEDQAMRFAEGLMTTLMDRTHPLWQLWFLEGYAPDKVGVFLKLHHVLADGAAVLNMVGLLFDLAPKIMDSPRVAWSPAQPPRAGLLFRDNARRRVDSLARAIRGLSHPLKLSRSVVASTRALWATIKEGLGAPRTSFNRPIGPSRSVAVMRIDLGAATDLAHASGTKVNDVILNVIAGGLREVLINRGEHIDGVSIRASMAVSLNSSDKSAVVGNHVGTMIVPLPLNQADARARLVAIGASTMRAKRRQRAAVPQTFMVLLALSGLSRFFIRRQRLVNVLATNLAGPPVPLYFGGAKLLDAFAITPIAGNVTASFAALSYDGHLDLSVHADASRWPDLDVLMEGMHAAWRGMSAHAIAA